MSLRAEAARNKVTKQSAKQPSLARVGAVDTLAHPHQAALKGCATLAGEFPVLAYPARRLT